MRRNTVILCLSDKLGQGDTELGEILAGNFFYALAEKEKLPKAIVFMNSGVFLVADSPCREGLSTLAEKGVKILVCGTCLDYYNLKKTLIVGEVSNIHDIADLLLGEDKVITI